jgi:hypothetical protein
VCACECVRVRVRVREKVGTILSLQSLQSISQQISIERAHQVGVHVYAFACVCGCSWCSRVFVYRRLCAQAAHTDLTEPVW